MAKKKKKWDDADYNREYDPTGSAATNRAEQIQESFAVGKTQEGGKRFNSDADQSALKSRKQEQYRSYLGDTLASTGKTFSENDIKNYESAKNFLDRNLADSSKLLSKKQYNKKAYNTKQANLNYIVNTITANLSPEERTQLFKDASKIDFQAMQKLANKGYDLKQVQGLIKDYKNRYGEDAEIKTVSNYIKDYKDIIDNQTKPYSNKNKDGGFLSDENLEYAKMKQYRDIVGYKPSKMSDYNSEEEQNFATTGRMRASGELEKDQYYWNFTKDDVKKGYAKQAGSGVVVSKDELIDYFQKRGLSKKDATALVNYEEKQGTKVGEFEHQREAKQDAEFEAEMDRKEGGNISKLYKDLTGEEAPDALKHGENVASTWTGEVASTIMAPMRVGLERTMGVSNDYSNTYRNTYNDEMKKNMSGAGKLVYDITKTGAEIYGSSMTGGALNFAVDSADQGYYHAKQNGATDEEALTYGGILGAVTGAIYKFGIPGAKSLFSKADAKGANTMIGKLANQVVKGEATDALGTAFVKSVGKGALKGAGTFAGISAATKGADVATQLAVLGDKSDYKRLYNAYKEQGLSNDEAWKNTAKDLGQQFVSELAQSAATGAVFGAAGAAVGGLRQAREYNEMRDQAETLKGEYDKYTADKSSPYFENVTDQAELDRQFKLKAKELHPDVAEGNEESFNKLVSDKERIEGILSGKLSGEARTAIDNWENFVNQARDILGLDRVLTTREREEFANQYGDIRTRLLETRERIGSMKPQSTEQAADIDDAINTIDNEIARVDNAVDSTADIVVPEETRALKSGAAFEAPQQYEQPSVVEQQAITQSDVPQLPEQITQPIKEIDEDNLTDRQAELFELGNKLNLPEKTVKSMIQNDTETLSPRLYANEFAKMYAVGKDTQIKSFDEALQRVPELRETVNRISPQAAGVAFSEGNIPSVEDIVRPSEKSKGRLVEDYKPTLEEATINQVLKRQAKATGLDIVVTDDISKYTDKDTAQGIAFLDNGKVVLNKDTANILGTADHEILGHFGKALAPKAYKELANIVSGIYRDDLGVRGYDNFVQMLKGMAEKQGVDLSESGAQEEAIAYGLETMAMNTDLTEKFIDKLQDSTMTEAEKKTILDKLKEFVKHVIDTLKKRLKNARVRQGTESMLREDIDYDKVVEAKLKVYEEIRSNLDAMSETEAKEVSESENKTKYSLKEIETEYDKAVKENDEKKAAELVKEYADSKGYDTKVYHGTKDFGFTQIDLDKSDDKTTFWATDNLETAGTYSDRETVRQVSESYKEEDLEKLSNRQLDKLLFTPDSKFEIIQSNNIKKRNQILDNSFNKLFRNAKEYKKENNDRIKEVKKLYNNWKNSNNINAVKKYFKDNPYGLISEGWHDVSIPDKSYGNLVNKVNQLFNEGYNTKLFYDNEYDVIYKYDKENIIKRLVEEYQPYGNYEFYSNIDNFLTVDAKSNTWSKVPYNGNSYKSREIAEDAKLRGYDGVLIENVKDHGGALKDEISPANVYIFFNPTEQVKSADPFTYDDQGNVIPLEKRFDKNFNDIRYSMENDGKPLSEVLKDKDNDKKELSKQNEIIIENPKDLDSLKFEKNKNRVRYPNVRGGWTIDKIQRELKQVATRKISPYSLKQFKNLDEIYNNLYYHGSTSTHENLKAGSTIPESRKTGGYGQDYHSISVSKSKNTASNFASMGKTGEVIPVVLKPDANVISMPNLEDSIDLEEFLPKLWEKNVDAVKVGDWDVDKNGFGEQELVILNPAAAVTIPAGREYFRNYKKPKFENLTKKELREVLLKQGRWSNSEDRVKEILDEKELTTNNKLSLKEEVTDRDIDKYKATRDDIGKALKLTKGSKLDAQGNRKLAAELKNTFGLQSASVTQIAADLEEIGTLIETKGIRSTDTMDRVNQFVTDLLKSEKQIDPAIQEAIRNIRNQKIYLSDKDVKQITDFKDFWKSAFGNLRLVRKPEGAMAVDEFFEHLKEYEPEVYNGVVEEQYPDASTLEELLDWIKTAKDDAYSLLDMYGDEAVDYYANEVLNAYSNAKVEDITNNRAKQRELFKNVGEMVDTITGLQKSKDQASEEVLNQMRKQQSEINLKLDEQKRNIERKYEQEINELKSKLANEKSNTQKQIKAIKEKAQARRKRESESRNKSDLRRKIRNRRDFLYKAITNPKINKHIPIPLQKPVKELANAIDMGFKDTIELYNTMRDNALIKYTGERLEEALARIDKREFAWIDKMDLIKRSLEAYIKGQDIDGNELKIKNRYGDSDTFYQPVIDMIEGLMEIGSNTSLMKMDVDQLTALNNTLAALGRSIVDRSRPKTIKIYDENNKELETYEDIAKAIMRQVGNFKLSKADAFFLPYMNGENILRLLGGNVEGGVADQLAKEFYKANREKERIEQKLFNRFSPVLNEKAGKTNLKLKSEVVRQYDKDHLYDVGLKTAKGEKILHNKDNLLDLYMHFENDDNLTHAAGGGIRIPSFKNLYANKSREEIYGKKYGGLRTENVEAQLNAFEEEIASAIEFDDYETLRQIANNRATILNNRKDYLRNEIKKNIESKFDDYDKKLIKAGKDVIEEITNMLNDFWEKKFGYRPFVVDKYWQIVVDPNFVGGGDAQNKQEIITNLSEQGFTIARQVNAKNPILSGSFIDRVGENIERAAKTIAYAGLQRDLNAIMKYTTDIEDDAFHNWKSTAEDVMPKVARNFVKVQQNLFGGANTDETPYDRIVATGRSAVMGGAITPKLNVGLAQLPSVLGVLKYVDKRDLASANLPKNRISRTVNGKKYSVQDVIDKYTAIMYARGNSGFSLETQDLKRDTNKFFRARRKIDRLTHGWIYNMPTHFDSGALHTEFRAILNYVRRTRPDLKEGTPEQIVNGESPLYKEAAKIFEENVVYTQPMFDAWTKNSLQLAKDPIVKSLASAFKTQPYQYVNLLYKDVAKFNAIKDDSNVSKKTKAKYRNAILKSASIIIGAMSMYVAFKMAYKATERHNDEDLTPGAIAKNMLGAFAGMFIGGSQIVDAVYNAATGKKPYDVEILGTQIITEAQNLIYNTGKFLKDPAGNADKMIENIEAFANNIGIPVQNIHTEIDGLVRNIEDVMDNNKWDYSNERSDTQLMQEYVEGNMTLDDLKKLGVEINDESKTKFSNAVKKDYTEGTIDKNTAIKAMKDTGLYKPTKNRKQPEDSYIEGYIEWWDIENKYKDEYVSTLTAKGAQTAETNKVIAKIAQMPYSNVHQVWSSGNATKSPYEKLLTKIKKWKPEK